MYICTVQTYIQYTNHIQTYSILIADGSWTAVKERMMKLAGRSNLKIKAWQERTKQKEEKWTNLQDEWKQSDMNSMKS